MGEVRRVMVMDTSQRRAFVGAVEDGIPIVGVTSDVPTVHAERLVGMMQEVLGASGWGRGGPDLVVVGRGPGSFTGVRVGVATAKGWAFARKIPVVGVVSLDAMGYAAARRVGKPGISLIDARKGEVFSAMYDGDGCRLADPVHLPRGQFGAWLEAMERQAGRSCAWLAGEVAASLGVRPELVLRSEETDEPSPWATATLGLARWARAGRDELMDLDPLYVRPPDITTPAVKSTRAGGSA
jgi:tRNA threonylcarbamoyl adenosine modification protein YeaZ